MIMAIILRVKFLVVEESRTKPFRRTWPAREAMNVFKEAGLIKVSNSNA